MVDLCPVVKWWSENGTKKSLFMVQNVGYLNSLPNQLTLPYCPVFRWIWYSDGYCTCLDEDGVKNTSSMTELSLQVDVDGNVDIELSLEDAIKESWIA